LHCLVFQLIVRRHRSVLQIIQKHPQITHLAPLPRDDFRFYVTLFPKCFSAFVHTTCPLSVSHPCTQPWQTHTCRLTLHSQAARLTRRLVQRERRARVRGSHPPRPTARRIICHGTRHALLVSQRARQLRRISRGATPKYSAPGSVPVRSPLTAGVTVVFLSSAD